MTGVLQLSGLPTWQPADCCPLASEECRSLRARIAHLCDDQWLPHRWRNSEYSGLFSGSLLEIIKRLREALALRHCINPKSASRYAMVWGKLGLCVGTLTIERVVKGAGSREDNQLKIRCAP